MSTLLRAGCSLTALMASNYVPCPNCFCASDAKRGFVRKQRELFCAVCGAMLVSGSSVLCSPGRYSRVPVEMAASWRLLQGEYMNTATGADGLIMHTRFQDWLERLNATATSVPPRR